jgi:hypothetical protein
MVAEETAKRPDLQGRQPWEKRRRYERRTNGVDNNDRCE